MLAVSYRLTLRGAHYTPKIRALTAALSQYHLLPEPLRLLPPSLPAVRPLREPSFLVAAALGALDFAVRYELEVLHSSSGEAQETRTSSQDARAHPLPHSSGGEA